MLLFCQLPTTEATISSIDQLVTTPADISDVKATVSHLYVFKNTVP